MGVFHVKLQKWCDIAQSISLSAKKPSLLALVKASHSTIIFVTAITTIFGENSKMQRDTVLFESYSTVIILVHMPKQHQSLNTVLAFH